MKRIFRTRDFQPDPRRDLDEELQSHLELKVEALMATGLPEEEARTKALETLGKLERTRERATAHSRTRLRRQGFRERADALLRDLRYAFRRMARSPGFTLIAVVSLAIGIGANTAIFSMVNAVLLRPLPYSSSDELVRIYTDYPNLAPWGSSAYPDYLEMEALDDVFAGVGVFYDMLAPVTLGEDPRMAMVEAVSSGFFPLLGVEPVLGRWFLPEEDDVPGQDPVVLLGYSFWHRSFGGDPEVLGETVRISGQPYTVVGVTPEWFGSGTFNSMKADLFVPVTMASTIEGWSNPRAYTQRTLRTYDIEARLMPGVTVDEARTRLDLLAARLQEAYPESNQDRRYRILPAEDVITSPELDREMPFIAAFLLAVVGLVLLLACTNLASFLLAQGVQRRKEIAMRLALGARRGRIVRQLLSETVLLALLGGGAGLLVASWTLGFLVRFLPTLPVNINLEVGLDWRVLLFTLAISLGAGVLFGVLPALRSTRPDISRTLKDSGPATGRRRFTLQSGLVALQMTISVVLLVGGGLFVRALLVAENIDPGFTSEAGVAWLDLAMSGIPREEWAITESGLMDRLAAEPGIESVAGASHLPLVLGRSHQLFTIPGVDPPAGQDGHRIFYAQVSPGYFETMGIPVLAGREFDSSDQPGSPEVVVVSEAMARTFWPGENPMGKQVLRGASERAATVVGVAKDTKVERLGEAPVSFVYFPRTQYPAGDLRLVARGQDSPEEIVATLRRVLREVNPNFALIEAKTMKEHLAFLLFPSRVAAFLLGAFGTLALALAAIGLYGVVSFAVSRRTREMGIRLSVGADTGAVVRMMMGGALAVVALGGGLGLAAAYALARFIRVFLFGIPAGDPVTMLGVLLLLGSVAALAAFIPARRASRVNPVEALRTE